MAAPTPERRAAMRALFELYHIPPPLIATVAGYQTETVEQYIRNQEWTVLNPLLDLRDRLIEKMRALVGRFANAGSDPADDEKIARTLMSLLKSLEQMNGLNPAAGRKAGHDTSEPETGEPDFTLGLAGGPDHTEELDRRLASLLADAAQQQEA